MKMAIIGRKMAGIGFVGINNTSLEIIAFILAGFSRKETTK